MFSIWEQKTFFISDITIIGAGITGLSTAASLKEKYPNLSITVLERGILPAGASTKNAGFACFGSMGELYADWELLGGDALLSMIEMRWKGLQKTASRLGKKTIDLQIKGGYELYFEASNLNEKRAHLNDLLFPIFKQKVFIDASERLKKFGFARTQHLIENPLEGQLDTGKLIAALWKYCISKGIKVLTGFTVSTIEEETDHVCVRSTEQIAIKSRKIALCTNAFTNQLNIPTQNITPGRGLVLLINPSHTLPFEGTFHYHHGFYYFRDYYGKLIFGGGRNLNIAAESTTEFGINEQIKQKLISELHDIILPKHSFKIDAQWSGIMAFGNDKMPIIQPISNKIVLGVRLNGMGIAIGSSVGQQVADLLLATPIEPMDK